MASSPEISVSPPRAPASTAGGLDPIDELRADTYRFLAALLAAPPNAEVLEVVKQAGIGDDGALGRDAVPLAEAWQLLRLAARNSEPERLDDEYHDLFIGIGRGELVPYASWYLTGFLMDRPLAYLRQDLRYLGIERQEGVSEPEDHAAALCEAMHEVIRAPEEISRQWQRKFFQDHIATWMGLFFRDLQQARCACFYSTVGRLGEAFIELEARYLDVRS